MDPSPDLTQREHEGAAPCPGHCALATPHRPGTYTRRDFSHHCGALGQIDGNPENKSAQGAGGEGPPGCLDPAPHAGLHA